MEFSKVSYDWCCSNALDELNIFIDAFHLYLYFMNFSEIVTVID